jgi:PAS domain S-box-containing protein
MEKKSATPKRTSRQCEQMEKALHENQATIQALIDATPESAMLVDTKGTVLAINEIAAQRFGKSKEGIIGQIVYGFMPPEIAEKRTEKLTEVLVSGKPVCFADVRSGRDYYNNFYPVLDSKGNVEKVAIFAQDLTMQHQTELALRESEQRFRNIFENAPIGFYRTTPDGRVLDANPALLTILGYSSFEQLASINLESAEYPPDYPRRLFRERIERDSEIKGMESFWKRTDNTLVYIRENARAIRDAGGIIVCYEGTIEDITESKRAEKQIHAISQQLIRAQEAERQRISRELHDCVAQDLSTLKIGFDTLFDSQEAVHGEISQKIEKLSEMLQKTISAVRDLSYDLQPPGLDHMGLVSVLETYCEEFSEQSGLKIDLHCIGMKNLQLHSESEINVYRLIQEGLNNVKRHAGASRVTVKLLGASSNVILRIEDDGVGFDVEKRAVAAVREKRMGLLSMEERVGLLQGHMTIWSQPKRGTRIFIKFPYREKTDA